MISFHSIKSAGDLDRERAVFRVEEDGNIGTQAILRNKYWVYDGKNTLQSVVYDTHWFVDKDVKKGDLVVLYSKGSNVNSREKLSESGSKTHFFYWEREAPIWDKDRVALVIITLDQWTVGKFVEHDDNDVEPN